AHGGDSAPRAVMAAAEEVRMADSDRTWNGLVPMEDADVEIEKNEPDPRGWDVISGDGRKIGEVDGMFVDTAAMKVRYLEVPVDNDELELDDDAERRLMIPVRSVELDVDDERVLVPTLQSARIAGLRGRVDLARESFGTPVSPDRATTGERMGEAEREVEAGRAERARRDLEAGRADLAAERDPGEGRPVAGETGLHTDLAARVRALENRVSDGGRDLENAQESSTRRRPIVREELVLVKRTIRDGNIEETDVHREPIDSERQARSGGVDEDSER
ncbi:MAG TPA: PRC-barrel domain-containing protein, partial [Longimicrobiales bacterium]